MIPLVVVGILLVILLGVWGYFFLRYRASPAGAWKKRVMDHYAALNRRLAQAQSQIDHTQRDKDRACDRIHTDYRDRFLRSITVAALDDYPNIGPATVEALHQAGFRGLADFNILTGLTTRKVPGIGEVKWGQITSAVAQLRANCEDQFRRGAFPDAGEMNARLQAADRELEQRAVAAASEVQAIQLTRDQMAEQVAMAQKVTFFGSLSGQTVPGLTDEFMNIPLPKVGPMVMPTPPIPHQTESPAAGAPEPPRPKSNAKAKTNDPFADYVPESSTKQDPAPRVIKTHSAQNPAPAPSPANDAFDEAGCRKILQIDPAWELSVELIRRQYHQLSEKNDPDKLKNMAEDVIAFARQKRDSIHKAAETLIAKFGEPLEKPAAPIHSDPRHNPDLDAVFG